MRRAWVFTSEQAEELRAHLAALVPESDPAGADIEAAVAAIDFSANCCASGTTPSDWKRLKKANHVHMRAVEDAAIKLRTLLSVERDNGQNSRPLTAGVDWSALNATLERVSESARVEADAFRPQPGERRPPDEWRDDLIATIYSVYPPGTAKKSIGSHFEQTVELVLGYLGRDIESVHDLIVKALRRQPKPTFVVRTTAKQRAK